MRGPSGVFRTLLCMALVMAYVSIAMFQREEFNKLHTKNQRKLDYTNYVIGSMVKMYSIFNDESLNQTLHEFSNRWPNSIVHNYLREVGSFEYGFQNVTALLRVIDWKRANMRTTLFPNKNDTLVVHLLLGGTLTQPYLTNLSRSVLDLWESGNFVGLSTSVRYNYNRDQFDLLMKNLPLGGIISKAVIVGSDTHHNAEDTTHRNKEYRELVASYLRNKSLDVSFFHGEDPDEAFVYMANAGWFLGGVGDDSLLVAACVAHRGGHVLFDSFGAQDEVVKQTWAFLWKRNSTEPQNSKDETTNQDVVKKDGSGETSQTIAKPDYTDCRIGDTVKMYGVHNEDAFNQTLFEHQTRWPNSIGHDYLKEVGSVEHGYLNMSALFRVIDRRRTIVTTPSNDTLVVHLRLGDTLTQPYLTNLSRSVLDLWEHGNFVGISTGLRYNYNHHEFDHLLKDLPNNITKAVIVGSTVHQNGEGTTPRNEEYRELVASYMRNRTLAVSYFSGEDPDEDFIYMASAKWLLGGMGGYTQLAAACVALCGGHVFANSFGADTNEVKRRWDVMMKDKSPK